MEANSLEIVLSSSDADGEEVEDACDGLMLRLYSDLQDPPPGFVRKPKIQIRLNLPRKHLQQQIENKMINSSKEDSFCLNDSYSSSEDDEKHEHNDTTGRPSTAGNKLSMAPSPVKQKLALRKAAAAKLAESPLKPSQRCDQLQMTNELLAIHIKTSNRVKLKRSCLGGKISELSMMTLITDTESSDDFINSPKAKSCNVSSSEDDWLLKDLDDTLIIRSQSRRKGGRFPNGSQSRKRASQLSGSSRNCGPYFPHSEERKKRRCLSRDGGRIHIKKRKCSSSVASSSSDIHSFVSLHKSDPAVVILSDSSGEDIFRPRSVEPDSQICLAGWDSSDDDDLTSYCPSDSLLKQVSVTARDTVNRTAQDAKPAKCWAKTVHESCLYRTMQEEMGFFQSRTKKGSNHVQNKEGDPQKQQSDTKAVSSSSDEESSYLPDIPPVDNSTSSQSDHSASQDICSPELLSSGKITYNQLSVVTSTPIRGQTIDTSQQQNQSASGMTRAQKASSLYSQPDDEGSDYINNDDDDELFLSAFKPDVIRKDHDHLDEAIEDDGDSDDWKDKFLAKIDASFQPVISENSPCFLSDRDDDELNKTNDECETAHHDGQATSAGCLTGRYLLDNEEQEASVGPHRDQISRGDMKLGCAADTCKDQIRPDNRIPDSHVLDQRAKSAKRDGTDFGMPYSQVSTSSYLIPTYQFGRSSISPSASPSEGINKSHSAESLKQSKRLEKTSTIAELSSKHEQTELPVVYIWESDFSDSENLKEQSAKQ